MLETGNTSDGIAIYSTFAGNRRLAFVYTVRAGDNTRDLAYIGTDALRLNGATLKNEAGTVDADLTLPVPGTENSLSGTGTIVLDDIAPDFIDTGTEPSPHEVTVATGHLSTSTVYNAKAQDAERAEDVGIAYTLGGTDSLTFSIDTDSGVLTPVATLDGINTYSVTITATDEFDNASILYLQITVVDLPLVTITDTIADLANIADGALTFTLSFDEPVTGFTDSITVAGGTKGTLTPDPLAATTYSPTDTFALVVTPDTANDGTLLITLPADAATAVAGTSPQHLGNRAHAGLRHAGDRPDH